MQTAVEPKPARVITIQMRREIHAAVKAAAEEDYMNISRWVERAVQEALSRRKNGQTRSK